MIWQFYSYSHTRKGSNSNPSNHISIIRIQSARLIQPIWISVLALASAFLGSPVFARCLLPQGRHLRWQRQHVRAPTAWHVLRQMQRGIGASECVSALRMNTCQIPHCRSLTGCSWPLMGLNEIERERRRRLWDSSRLMQAAKLKFVAGAGKKVKWRAEPR